MFNSSWPVSYRHHHFSLKQLYWYLYSHSVRSSCRLISCLHFPTDNLNNALGAIRVLGFELIEDELKPHLNTVLINIKEKSESVYTLLR